MSLLGAAAVQDVKRLLELFPVSILKDQWRGEKGTKEEVCFAAASERNLWELGSENNFFSRKS